MRNRGARNRRTIKLNNIGSAAVSIPASLALLLSTLYPACASAAGNLFSDLPLLADTAFAVKPIGKATATTRVQRAAELAVQQGRKLLEAGKVDQAIPVLQSAIEADPNQAEAMYWLGIAQERLGNLFDAVVFINQASALAPENVRLRMEYARLLGRAGRLGDAETAYRSIIASVDDTEVRLEAERLLTIVKGERITKSGDAEAALRYYQEMTVRNPDDLALRNSLGRLYVGLGRLKEAEAVYLKLAARAKGEAVTSALAQLANIYQKMGDEGALRGILERAVALDPKSPLGEAAVKMLLRKGKEYLKENKPDEAMAAFKAVLVGWPYNPVANFAVAQMYQLQKKYDEAEAAYKNVLAAEPDNLNAHSRLAHMYVQFDRLDDAIAAFEEVAKAGDTTEGREASANLKILYSTKAERVVREITEKKEAPDEYVTMVQKWLEKNHPQPAQRVLEAVLEIKPDDAEAHYWLGTIYDRSQRFDLAVEHIARSVALAPDNVRLISAYARVLARANRFQEAEEKYQDVIRRAGESPLKEEAERLLGYVQGQRLTREGKLEEALSHYKELQQRFPDDISLLGRIGTAYLRLNRYREAEMMFKLALKHDKDRASVYMRLASLYEKTNNVAARNEAFKQVLALDPNGPLGQRAVAELGLREGILALRDKRWNVALLAFQKVLDSDPNNISANLGAGTAYMENRQLEQAELVFRKVLAQDPSSLDARLRLARILVATKRIDEAALELERVFAAGKDTPQGREALTNLTNIYREHAKQLLSAGDIAGAILEYRTATNRDPDDLEAHMSLGDIYQRVRRLELAMKEYQEAARIDPEHSLAFVNMGNIYESRQKFQEALDNYVKALSFEHEDVIEKPLITAVRLQTVRLEFSKGEFDWVTGELVDMIQRDPGDARLYLLLGIVYTRLEQFEDAIEVFRKAVDESSGNLEARFRLGLLYEQTSDDELALDQYRTILRAQNSGPIAENARGRMVGVEERLRHFSYELQYGSAYGNTFFPEAGVNSPSFSSTLRLTLASRFRPTKDLNLGVSVVPTYSGFHTSESDSLSQLVSASAQLNKRNSFFSAGANYRETASLLLEDFNGRTINASLAAGKRLRIPLFLSEKGQPVPKTLQLRLSAVDFKSTDISLFQTRTLGAGTSFSYPLSRGGSVTAAYDFTLELNTHPYGRDYANRAQGVTISGGFPMAPKLTVQLGGNLKFLHYLYPDSGILYSSGIEKRRKSGLFGISMGFNYRLHPDVSLYADYNFTEYRSDVTRGYIYNPAGFIVGVQSSTLGDYQTQSLTLGLRFRF